ncbi:Zn(2)-C6 fungal-type DNA-binding domain [Penicillium roqueforti FM164]|uniref:Zn(2)-C6 fungal-type DNA-binding domain n=1 Tax=Penicillium roqueforti (strain FM164) TaxID=1365484 RepID=W6PZ26_PENRF|nr:Zn(2)-C6 fungal-type DNA-binding domain [Penicillium roqueforti FM164]
MDSASRRRLRRRVADENRKRAPRACDRCKARKSKCVEATPGKCQRCLASNLACMFGREKSPVTQDTASSDLPEPGIVATSTRNRAQLLQDDISHTDPLSPASVLSQKLAEHVVAGQSKRAPWPNILSRLREAFSLDPDAAPEERDMVAMQAHMTRPKALHPYEVARLHAAIDAFPPRLIADFLISVFIKHATDTFFYFDQDQILSEIDQFYTDTTSPLRSDLSFVCLAMAIFALGSQWTPLERPDEFAVSLHRDNDDLGQVFYTHAKTLIPDLIDRPCLRSIQAPFLLGVYLMPASAIGSSYVYMGLALRKALAFDLHLNPEDQAVDDREREVRCRLWWSIYSLERPRSVDANVVKVPHPSPLPALDRLQKYNNIQFQMAYARLIKILDRIAEPCGVTEAEEQSESEGLASDLRQWKKSLPPDFKLENVDTKDSRYRTIFHLYLNYYYAWITMGKVALVTVARTSLRYHMFPASRPPGPSEATLMQSRYCAKAGRKLLLLFENLTQTRKITRFSFTDFQGCSIATIVTLVAGITERDSGYNARVKFGLDCLRRMATGNMTAKLGVKFVEAVQSITNEAAEKLHQASSTANETQDVQNSASTSDYNQWAEWLTRLERSQTLEQRAIHEAEPDVPFPHTVLHPPQSSDNTSDWRTAGEQYIPESSTPQSLAHGSTMLREFQSIEYDLLSGFQSDDPAFLMGLTGIDVLDFSGLT